MFDSFNLGDRNYVRKLIIDLAIYSTVLDVFVFVGTINSILLNLDIGKVLLPVNIGLTIIIALIIALWLYLKISDLFSISKFFIARNFRFSFLTTKKFENGKFVNKRIIKFKIFSNNFQLSF